MSPLALELVSRSAFEQHASPVVKSIIASSSVGAVACFSILIAACRTRRGLFVRVVVGLASIFAFSRHIYDIKSYVDSVTASRDSIAQNNADENSLALQWFSDTTLILGPQALLFLQAYDETDTALGITGVLVSDFGVVGLLSLAIIYWTTIVRLAWNERQTDDPVASAWVPMDKKSVPVLKILLCSFLALLVVICTIYAMDLWQMARRRKVACTSFRRGLAFILSPLLLLYCATRLSFELGSLGLGHDVHFLIGDTMCTMFRVLLLSFSLKYAAIKQPNSWEITEVDRARPVTAKTPPTPARQGKKPHPRTHSTSLKSKNATRPLDTMTSTSPTTRTSSSIVSSDDTVPDRDWIEMEMPLPRLHDALTEVSSISSDTTPPDRGWIGTSQLPALAEERGTADEEGKETGRDVATKEVQ